MSKAGRAMLFNVYGRDLLEVVREEDRWVLYRVESGRRCRFTDFAIPRQLNENEIARYLDEMLHEAAWPGHSLRRGR